MSSSQGRSWRPEKKFSKRDSRRSQLIVVSVLLFSLLSIVAYLIFRPGVPLLRFVVVAEHGFRADETGITALPGGGTAFNAARLDELAQRFREQEPDRISDGETYSSISELVSGESLTDGESLIVYVGGEAWCVAEKDHPENIVLELLPAKPTDEPQRFSALLAHLQKRNSAQTVLLLELCGRQPGLASGVLADDVPAQIINEVLAAKIPGLTVICACDEGERSWEFVPENVTPVKADSVAAQDAASSKSASKPPTFRGTVFGHFLCRALADGNAGSAEELYRTMKAEVKPWVVAHFGESQNVWMVSADASAPKKSLLKRARVAEEKPSGGVQNSTEEASETAKTAETSPVDEKGPPAPVATSITDDRPAARLEVLRARRKVLADNTMAAVLFPADWLQLQTAMVAAERFAMNVDREEFDALHDSVLRRILTDLEQKTAATSLSDRRQAMLEWMALPSPSDVSQPDARVMKRIRDDFSLEPGKAPSRLPDEVEENPGFRKALISGFLRDLTDLSRTISDQPAAEQARLIQGQVFLVQNLASKWPQQVFPEPLTTVKEVLRGNNPEWLAAALKPLVRLLDLRRRALLLASGQGSDGRSLRRGQWSRIAGDIDHVLKNLHAAERWLCIGPEGKELAEDRLDLAEKSFIPLNERVAAGESLSEIEDAQRFQIVFLIQYLALRLDETPLQMEELKQVQEMASNAVAGKVSSANFPEGPLKRSGFSRNDIDAMFALTRDFSQAEVTESDLQHFRILERFVTQRGSMAVPASEEWQLLTLPMLPDREQHLSNFARSRTLGSSASSESPVRSGVWTSFWSLRLAAAIGKESHAEDWTQWSQLVSAIAASKSGDDKNGDGKTGEGKTAEAKTAEAANKRAVIAQTLRVRWRQVMEKLTTLNNAEIFPLESDLLELFSKDVTRRVQSTAAENQSLYTGIQLSILSAALRPQSSSIAVLNPDAEVSSESAVTTKVRIGNAVELYVLNDGLTLKNFPIKADRNWLLAPVNATDFQELSLDFQLREAPRAARPLMLVVVNADGAPVAATTTTLQPPADNAWSLEAFHVEEGKPDRSITLEELPSSGIRRLRLPPSTLDPVTRMDVPAQLRLKLRHDKGISKRVRIRAIHAESGVAAWVPADPLTIPDGDGAVVDIAFLPPASPATVAAPAAAATALPLDISRGLIFEITPDDLHRKVVSKVRIDPKLLEPERILQKPIPSYNPANSQLEIPLKRLSFDNSSALWPSKLPAQLELSPALREYALPGAILTTPDADGSTLKISFRPDIEQVLDEEGLEFGISVAGVPHAWWWKLTDGSPVILEGTPEVRAFLTVDNELEVPPIARSPGLLLGKGWRKAKMSAQAFLHGDQFNDGWSLDLHLQRTSIEGAIRFQDPPFVVRSRFVETVTMSPGENGVWRFSTMTAGYSVAPFEPARIPLENGNYLLNAALQKKGSSVDPAVFGVNLTLDDSAPVLREEDITINGRRTNVNGVLNGDIRLADPESGVKEVRVGLNPEMMTTLPIRAGNDVTATFQLDASSGFPKLEQKETDTEQTVSLLIETVNGAGEKTAGKKSVTFYLPGKKGPPEKMAAGAPGTIVVKFKSSSKYNVSLAGANGVAKELPDSSNSAVFSDLPPGKYSVEWKPVVGTSGKGSEEVLLNSGKTVTIGPGK